MPEPAIAFTLRITLLEDLHTGTGMGSVIVDRILARDARGRVLIPREHLKGVWRDNAERLVYLKQLEPDFIDQLFGAPGGRRGRLICPELIITGDRQPTPLFWDATARKPGDRAPDDHSLRRTEYLPAGTLLCGRGLLTGPTNELKDALNRINRFTTALGSERTRGSGLIQARLSWADNPDAETQPDCSAPIPRLEMPEAEADLTNGIRLLLHADAPVCIPTTGFPGNIIPSEDHIPGRTLQGALARWIIDQGQWPSCLLDRRVGVGPAYPLPIDQDIQSLADLTITPMPLCLWTPKPGEQPESSWPHWAGAAEKKPKDEDAAAFKDMLRQSDDERDADEDQQLRPDKTRYKRPQGHGYLLRRPNNGWTAFEAQLGLRMRNRRGHPIGRRIDDTDPPELAKRPEVAPGYRQINETEAELFTVEQIPRGTRFIADIHPLDPTDTTALTGLKDQLKGLLSTDAAPLRIGRGGAPVTLQGWCPAPPITTGIGGNTADDDLSILLQTDLIARTPDLGFHTKLTVAALRDALLTGADAISCGADGDKAHAIDDNQRIHGFNATSGLPTPPRIAIRRGSVLRIQGPCAAQVRRAVAGRTAIGEQTWEGHGRFLLDAVPDAEQIRPTASTSGSEERADDSRARTDRIIADAEALVAEMTKDRTDKPGLPGRSQLGNLRNHLSTVQEDLTADTLREHLLRFYNDTQARRGAVPWRRLFDEIEPDLIKRMQNNCAGPDGRYAQPDLQLYLRVLAQSAAEAERLAQEEPERKAEQPAVEEQQS